MMLSRRSWNLFTVLLLTFTGSVFAEAPKKLLLVGQGPDGHPFLTHEYMAGLRVLEKCLKDQEGLEVSVVKAIGPWKNGPELIGRSDGVVLFASEGAKWIQQDPARLRAFQQVARRKGGLSVIHWGMGTRKAEYIKEFVDLFGACHGGPDRKYIVVEVKTQLPTPLHPIVRGIKPIQVKDEFYYQLKRTKKAGPLTPIITVPIKGNEEMVSWAWQRPDGGRSFGFSGLHFHNNWERKEYRRLVSQGVLWSMGFSVPKAGLSVKITDEDLKVKPRKSN